MRGQRALTRGAVINVPNNTYPGEAFFLRPDFETVHAITALNEVISHSPGSHIV
jgi:hypothetical protein